MGILLFWGIPGQAPVVVTTDGGLKPKLSFVLDRKTLELFVEKTNALTSATTTTYNDSSTTYSSASQTYGGSDRIQASAPIIVFVNDKKTLMEFVKPDMIQINLLQKTIAVADSTTTVYNDANTTYSSSVQTYGGSDRIVDPPPQIVRIGS